MTLYVSTLTPYQKTVYIYPLLCGERLRSAAYRADTIRVLTRKGWILSNIGYLELTTEAKSVLHAWEARIA